MNACTMQEVRPDSFSCLTLPDVVLGTTCSYDDGEPIYLENDPVQHWYEVVSGAVRACKLIADGRRQVIEFYFAGDVFGFDDQDGVHTLSAEAAAEHPTVLTRYHRQRLDVKAAADPDISGKLRDLAFRALVRTRTHVLVLGRLSAMERVAEFLLEMDGRLRPLSADNSLGGFCLPMGRKDIADYLGLTPETLSRCLQTLRRSGVIVLSYERHIRINDRSRLLTANNIHYPCAGGRRRVSFESRPAAA